MSEKRKAEANAREDKRTLPEWLAVRLDVPPDMFTGGLRLELRGRNLLTVHGTRRILTYSPTCIRLEMKGAVLAIRGRRLGCTTYVAGAVCMDGRIDSMTFETEDESGESSGSAYSDGREGREC